MSTDIATHPGSTPVSIINGPAEGDGPDWSADGVVPLTPAEVVELVRAARVGRIMHHLGGLPIVDVVGITTADADLLIQVPAGAGIPTLAGDIVLALQTDRVDPADGTGWSVTVVGTASPDSAAPGVPPRHGRIRLTPRLVAGRRVTGHGADGGCDPDHEEWEDWEAAVAMAGAPADARALHDVLASTA